MFNVQCTMYNVQCTMYNVQCAMYNVQCTMCNVRGKHSLSEPPQLIGSPGSSYNHFAKKQTYPDPLKQRVYTNLLFSFVGIIDQTVKLFLTRSNKNPAKERQKWSGHV